MFILTYHCWTYKNKVGQWCVTENKPCVGSSDNSDVQSEYQARSDEILCLLQDIKEDLSHYSPDKKIKAEQRQREHGNTAPGKPRNTGGKFATSVIDVSSDNTHFEQGKELEQTEKSKAKERHESTLPEKGKKGFNVVENLPPHKNGKTWDKVAEKIGETKENLPSSNNKQTRDKVAEKTGETTANLWESKQKDPAVWEEG